MKTLRNQITAELRQLPGILGKFIGGATVAIGTLAAVLGYKHDSLRSITFGVIAFGAGCWLFARSSRWLKERKDDLTDPAAEANARLQLSVLTWGLLACAVVVLLLIVQIMTGI